MTADSAERTTTAKNLAVFIDADNLNDPTALDHVLTSLRSMADRVLYKRAYGRTESLKGIEAVLWRHGVRPVANMIVNKVTTDSALVIDAVEAVCTHNIDAVAICSGDADFVPLATWMRERGCHVFCFSLSNKIFANPESFYDDVVLLEVVEKPEPDALPPEPVAAKNLPELQPPAALSVAAKLAAPPAAVPLKSVNLSDTEVVQQVLKAFPALRSGQPQHLSQVVAALRQRGILDKGTKTTVWFAQWDGVFQLRPCSVPNQIIYKKRSVPVAVRPLSAVPKDVERVLQAIPHLRHQPQMLNHVVPILRQKAVLAKTTKSTVFLACYPEYFKLTPSDQPVLLTYLSSQPVLPVTLAAPALESPPRAHASASATPHAPAAAALSWPVTLPRRPARPLLAELHGLRSVLGQLAIRRVSAADVLLAAPEMLKGQWCLLAAVAGRLREKNLLLSQQSALRVLERYPLSFSLQVERMPQTVRYLR